MSRRQRRLDIRVSAMTRDKVVRTAQACDMTVSRFVEEGLKQFMAALDRKHGGRLIARVFEEIPDNAPLAATPIQLSSDRATLNCDLSKLK